jgi:hypothetical protein
VLIEAFAVRRLHDEPEIARAFVTQQTIAPAFTPPWPLRAALRTLFVTFLFSGAIESTMIGLVFALVVFTVLLGARAYAAAVVPRVKPVLAIPVIVRIAVAVALSYPAVYRIASFSYALPVLGESYAGLLVAAVVTLILTVLLAPDMFVQRKAAS